MATRASGLAHLVLCDFNVGVHGDLFDDRRLTLADSWPFAAEGANRWLKIFGEPPITCMSPQLSIETASKLVADDKGLLAMDESNSTCDIRFAKLTIPQTVEARRAYRELIVTTPGLGECVEALKRGA